MAGECASLVVFGRTWRTPPEWEADSRKFRRDMISSDEWATGMKQKTAATRGARISVVAKTQLTCRRSGPVSIILLPLTLTLPLTYGMVQRAGAASVTQCKWRDAVHSFSGLPVAAREGVGAGAEAEAAGAGAGAARCHVSCVTVCWRLCLLADTSMKSIMISSSIHHRGRYHTCTVLLLLFLLLWLDQNVMRFSIPIIVETEWLGFEAPTWRVSFCVELF